jgi:crossover junction endonuclease MUS81
VIYLIEEFNVTHDSSSSNALRYQEMAATAMASTQVVNGYFVKKTKNLDDTIRYLARMTFLLRKMYELSASSPQISSSNAAKMTPVALIPSAHLSSQSSYLATLQTLRSTDPSKSTTYGVTFSTFSALTSKSDVLTLRDVFLKMLMCTRGVTGEKALEIQRRWPTPRHFIEAFEAVDRESSGGLSSRDQTRKAKEKMITDKMAKLVGRKKVQVHLSRRLAENWGEEGA